MNTTEAQELFRKHDIKLRAGAVRRHPRRGQGEGRAGRTSRHGARRRRRLRRLRAVGLRHGARTAPTTWRSAISSTLHAICRGCRAMRASSATARSSGKPYPYCSRVALQRQLDRLDRARADDVHRHRARIHAAGARRRRHARALRRHRHARQALLRLQGPVARQRVPRRAGRRRCAPVGIDVYQIDHEDANGQFEVNFTYADALKSADNFMLREDGGQRDRARARHDRHVHAEAVLESHRQRRALPHLAGQRQARRTCSTTSRTSAGWRSRRLAYHFLGGLLAHARALAARVRADGQFVQAAGGGPRAVRRNLGAGLHRVRRQQSHGMRAHPGGRLELRLPDSGCNPYLALPRSSPPASTASSASSIRASRTTSTSTSSRRADLKRAGIGAAAAEPARSHQALEADAVVQHGHRRGSRRGVHPLKRMEWIEYSRHVSDWETQRYLEFF